MVEVRDCPPLVFFAHRDAPALLAGYAEESALDGLPTPKPHEATYFRRESAGVQHVLGAFLGAALIGFLVLVIDMNGHYSEKLAVVESVFVAKEHRKTGAFDKLLAAAEERAGKVGAAGLFLTAAIAARLEKVMDHKPDYRESHRVFFKSLL